MGRSSREDRVKNETIKEIMRHKWLSENRKLQWVDQILMTEKRKQPKQVMKWELRSSKSARLFTGGLRCFEAKDTVRKVFERGWGAGGKQTAIKSRATEKRYKAWRRQRPKGAGIPCAAAGPSGRGNAVSLG